MSVALEQQFESLRQQMLDGFASLARAPSPVDTRPVPTLEQLHRDFIAATQRTRATGTRDLRDSRIGLFRRWALTQGVELASGLSRQLIEAYDEHLRTTGHRHPLEASSRRTVIGVLLTWWAWAESRGVWAVPPAPRSIEMPVPIPASVHAPTWEQADAVLAQIRAPKVRRAVILERCLGLRIGQVCQLRWRDFSADLARVSVRKELGKSALEKTGRDLPVPAALCEEMRLWPRGAPDELIVGVTPATVRKTVARAWRDAGAPENLFVRRPNHAFRKGLTTEALAAGVPSDTGEYWCGRRTAGQTGSYTDPRAHQLQQLADAVPRLAAHARGAPLYYLLFPEGP